MIRIILHYSLGEVSIANRPYLLFQHVRKPLILQNRPSKPKAREGHQVNESKSRMRGSEEIPSVNEESIRLLSGL